MTLNNDDAMMQRFLETLPPLLEQAGRIALEKRAEPGIRYKSDTGNEVSDIVTEADEAVQEFLLQALLKTELRHCRMFAEEDTPAVDLFPADAPYLMSLDPIDGTLHYAKKGTDRWQIIIQLKTQFKQLVTLIYFPPNGGLMKIDDTGVYYNDQPVTRAAKRKPILHPLNLKPATPQAKQFAKTHNLAIEQGPEFEQSSFITYAQQHIRGVWAKNISAYDGLTWLHITTALGGRAMELTSGKQLDKDFDYFQIQGDRYPFEFVALFPE